MTVEAPLHTPVDAVTSRRFLRKLWLMAAAAVALLLASVVILLVVKWPFTEQALIKVLQERTERRLTIGKFRATYFPPGCVAEQISFLHPRRLDKPPLITMQRLTVRGTYWGLIRPQKHLVEVRLEGLHATVPPSSGAGKPNPVMPLTRGTAGPPLLIGTVVADGAALDFVQRTPGRKPVRVFVDQLRLNNVGNNLPLDYHAIVHNSGVPSTIESGGRFGVWNDREPASTPVQGWYRVSNEDLGVYKALRGKLEASGRFNGVLGDMSTNGSVKVRGFQVVGSSHIRDVEASFTADVAATDGNVALRNVSASFDHSTIEVNGSFESVSKEPGKAVALHVTSKHARVEDILGLFIAGRESPMTGDAELQGQFWWPQNLQSVLRDMTGQATFRIRSGQFTDESIQQDLANLSQSAEKKEHQPEVTAETLRSELDGDATLRNGVAELSRFELRVPGAISSLTGPYSLLDYSMNLHGRLLTKGSPSAAVTGFKSIVLKGMSPFMKAKGGMKAVPFRIVGQYHHTSVTLDFGHQSKVGG